MTVLAEGDAVWVIDDAAIYDMVDGTWMPDDETMLDRRVARLILRGFKLSSEGEVYYHPNHWLEGGGAIGWLDDVGYSPRTVEAEAWLSARHKEAAARRVEWEKSEAERRAAWAPQRMRWPWVGHETCVVHLLRENKVDYVRHAREAEPRFSEVSGEPYVVGRICKKHDVIEVHLLRYENSGDFCDRRFVVDSTSV